MPSPGSTVPSRALVVTRPTRLRRALGAGLTTLLVGSLVACGGDEEPTTSPTGSTTSAAPSASESASASPTATTSPSASESGSASTSPEPTPSASAPAGGSLADVLLTADQVPGLNDDSPWTQGATGAVGEQPFGWCARTGASTIGAQDGVQRDFTSGDDRAAQQVLDFVDPTNARRAEQVFRGWHRDCRGARVRPVQSLPVAGGTAFWYLASRSGGDGTWEAFGLARVGARITVLRMEHTGQDHSYAPGEDPLERALATAADRLG